MSAPVYEGFGPTLAVEYLREKHGITVSKETVRQWMMRAKLWQGEESESERDSHVAAAAEPLRGIGAMGHQRHTTGWKGGERMLYLIAMIDDATSRLFARFVRHDSTEENMKLLWSYLEKFGRPVSFYTDKASLFQTAEKAQAGRARGGQGPQWKCRRRRLGARYKNWGSAG